MSLFGLQTRLKQTTSLPSTSRCNITAIGSGSAVTMCLSMKQLTHFLDDMFVLVHERHTQAVDEFLRFHEQNKLPSLNDYTVYTVIQDKPRKGRKNKASVVNTKTGEIVQEFVEESAS
jgi:hypothetical protein